MDLARRDLKLHRVVKGHSGWVWDLAVDPENEWFASASADQTIKIWSLATGKLKLTLTGHRLPVRALAISPTFPYMFSGSEDNQVLCWDLEHNKPVRQYHGHRSGVYTVALHPEIPYLLASGSRDSSVRVWDVRTRLPLHVLTGHDGAVNKVVMQGDAPQLVSCSQDRTIRFWDIVSGRCLTTLTQPENSVRGLWISPEEYSFASAGLDGIRQWSMPNGELLGTFGSGAGTLVGDNNTLYAGGNHGFQVYEYSSGQLTQEVAAPSVLGAAIDFSGSRLISGHTDNSIRMWIT